MDVEFMKILIAILIRIFAGFAGYWTVVRRLVKERKHIPEHLKDYNTKLIISVSTFILTCFGTSLFQACRVGWIPYCNAKSILDDIAIFNSLGLLAAWYVMDLMIKYKPKVPDTDSKTMTKIRDIQKNLKTIGGQTKRAEVRNEEIDLNTNKERGKIMRGVTKVTKNSKQTNK